MLFLQCDPNKLIKIPNKQTNRLGQKTPLIKVSYSKRGNCLLCILMHTTMHYIMRLWSKYLCKFNWNDRPYKRSVLGPKRLIYFFMNNIFNLKRNCVLRTLKNSFAIFWAWRTYTHTYIHTHIHTRLGQTNLVFWGPRSFQFDLEMNINIYCMYYIIIEDYWRP